MLRLEKRPQPSREWTALSPLLAVALTMLVGGILFAILGANPFEAIRTIFWDPIFSEQFSGFTRPQLLGSRQASGTSGPRASISWAQYAARGQVWLSTRPTAF